jgi:hypothetical protein
MVRKGKDAAPAVEEHPGGGHIVVTAQQSRYALDAIDAPASKEVREQDSYRLAAIYILTRLDLDQRPFDISLKPRVTFAHYTALSRSATLRPSGPQRDG